MRIVSRMNIPAPEKPAEQQAEQQNQSKIETTRNDHSQATIANFLQETKENETAIEEENESIEAHKK
jgi:hypothetical protein